MEGFGSPTFHDGGVSSSENTMEETIATLNKELITMGLPALYPCNSDTYDIRLVIECLQFLLGKHQRSSRLREQLENRLHRVESEESHHRLMQTRLKSTLEQTRRELAITEERERQLTLKNKTLTNKLKSEKEEVRRLQVEGKHRYSQFKHDLKKKERELTKLKERLNQVLSDRTQGKKVGMEISQFIQRGDKKRATWQTRDKQDGELQQVLIANFEHRQEELLLENRGLRECLHNVQKEFDSLLQDNDTRNGLNQVDISFDADDISVDSLSSVDITQGHFEMPYDIMRPNFDKWMTENYKTLKNYFQRVGKKKGNPGGRSSTSPASSTGTDGDQNEDHEQLQRRLAWYQEVIKEQEQLLQQTITNPVLQEHSLHFPDEEDQWKERENLTEEKKLFAQEKANFDDERKRFTDAAIRLSREREDFEKERANFLTKQILQLTPFKHEPTQQQNSICNTQASGKRRLLPSVQVFSPAPSRAPATPSTCELYRTLGLQNMDREDWPRDQDLASPRLKSSSTSAKNQEGIQDPDSSPIVFHSLQGNQTPSSRHSEHMENVKKAVFQHEFRITSPDGHLGSVS